MVTGIVRKFDELGRITIPKELRKILGVNERDPMEITLQDGAIHLKPYKSYMTTCVFCKAEDMDGKFAKLNNMLACPQCIKELVMNSEN